MTNEWLEFQAYIKKPSYSAESKHDLSYLGRFTFKTITDFEGFGRILTIIARGYLFHDQDGSLRGVILTSAWNMQGTLFALGVVFPTKTRTSRLPISAR